MNSAIFHRGIKSEKYVLEYLRSGKGSIEEFGKIKEIIEYSNYRNKEHKQKQNMGIDFDIVSEVDGEEIIISVDVKQDKWLSQKKNMLFEWKVSHENGFISDGWGMYCKADYIIWHAVSDNALYITDMKKFKQLTLDYVREHNPVPKKAKSNNMGKFTLSYCLPYQEVGIKCSNRYTLSK